jgi:hypothetical protein
VRKSLCAIVITTLIGTLSTATVSAAETPVPGPGDLVARDLAGNLWLHRQTGDPLRPWDLNVRSLIGSGWQGPDSVALSDISLDGRPDLFVRDPAFGGSIGYHGTWDPAVRVFGMSGWGTTPALIEDIDRDGRPDLLARQPAGNLRVWPHDGNTTASPWLTRGAYDVAEGLERTDVVRFGEVTGDELRDLIIREDDGTVWILPHPGAAAAALSKRAAPEPLWQWGKTKARTTLAASSADPYSVGARFADDVRLDVLDVNGDGLGDLLATDQAGRLRVHLHTGAPAGEDPWPAGVTLGDWSGYDLVAALPAPARSATLRVQPRTASLGVGATTAFRATLSSGRDVTREVTWTTADGTVATIDSAGVATGRVVGTTAVLATLAGASTGAAGLTVGGTGPGQPKPVTPGDAVGLDRDGRLWHYPHTGDPARPWSRTSRQLVGVDWAGPDKLILDDVTLDGRTDLFVRDPSATGSVWFHPNSGNPARPFSPGAKVFGMSGWNNAAEVILEDVNGDRRPDLLSRMPDGNLRFWLHDGRTTTSPWLSPNNWADIAVGLQTTTLVRFAEVTGDGRRDLIIRDRDGALWVLPRPATPVTPGMAPLWRWDPTTPPPGAYRIGTQWATSARLDLQDVDGDTRADLLTTDTAGTLTVFRHNGSAPGQNPWTTATTVPGAWSDGLIAFSSK